LRERVAVRVKSLKLETLHVALPSARGDELKVVGGYRVARRGVGLAALV